MIYQWTDANVDHLSKHDVVPDDAEHVVGHARSPFPARAATTSLSCGGRPRRVDFCRLFFVHLPDDEVDFESLSPTERLRFLDGEGVGLIIHAMDLTADMKRQYRRTMR